LADDIAKATAPPGPPDVARDAEMKTIHGNPTASAYDQVGVTGLKAFSGYVLEEYLPELMGQKALKAYKTMGDDPIVTALLTAITLILRAVDWRVEPADDGSDHRNAHSAKAEQEAEFAQGLLDDMSHPWEDVINETLSMLQYGWAYLEIVLKTRLGPDQDDPAKRSKFNDGRIGVRKLPIRAQESLLRWQLQEDGGVEGMWQQPPQGGQQLFIPIERALLFRTTSKKNSPEGVSILRAAYRPWFIKRGVEDHEAIGIERELAGLPVVSIPKRYLEPGASGEDLAFANTARMLARDIKLNSQAGVVIPSEPFKNPDGTFSAVPMVKLELLSSGGSGKRAIDTDIVVKRYNRLIAMSAMADFITLGDEKGSYSLSQNKSELFLRSCESYLNQIAAVVNRFLFPRIFAYNGIDPALIPVLKPGRLAPVDLNELGTYVAQLAAAGAPLFPNQELSNYLADVAGLPEPPEDIGLQPPPGKLPRFGQINPDTGEPMTLDEHAQYQQADLGGTTFGENASVRANTMAKYNENHDEKGKFTSGDFQSHLANMNTGTRNKVKAILDSDRSNELKASKLQTMALRAYPASPEQKAISHIHNTIRGWPTQKYNENHDELGRFSSGGAALADTKVNSKGKDVLGRDIPDWRGAHVYHSTDEASAKKIEQNGYKTGSGYYGNMVSFTPDSKYTTQFGPVTTQAKISENAKILNLNDPHDWETFQRTTAGVPSDKYAEAIKRAGYHGLYDVGAGDLFIADPSVARFEGAYRARLKKYNENHDELGRFSTGSGGEYPHTITVEHHPETGSKKPYETWSHYDSGRKLRTASFKTQEAATESARSSADLLSRLKKYNENHDELGRFAESGYTYTEGKGPLGRGKWQAHHAESGLTSYNLHPTKEQAAADLSSRLDANARRDTARSERASRLSDMRDRHLAGGEVTESDVKTLGLKAHADMRDFIPAAAELHSVSSRSIRPALGDTKIRVTYSDGGTKLEGLNSREGLSNIAASFRLKKYNENHDVAGRFSDGSGDGRTFWRGSNPGDARRIKTGNESWDSHLFVADNQDDARMYGSHLTQYEAALDAKILREGTAEFRNVAGSQRKNENLLDYASRAANSAKAAGYDAVWFKRQGDVGTAILNPAKFQIKKYNENHDELGRFAEGGGGALSGRQLAEQRNAHLKDPAHMTNAQLKNEHAKLSEKSSELASKLIEAGRGSEKFNETAAKTDPLAVEYHANSLRRSALRQEVMARYGPDLSIEHLRAGGARIKL
jgi:hypothetical protein